MVKGKRAPDPGPPDAAPSGKQMILGENELTVECRADMEVMHRCHDFVERIKLGNVRIWEAWDKLCKVPFADRDPWLTKWDEAYERLFKMNESVMLAGWHWCLYGSQEEFPMQWCLVCPCTPFNAEHCQAMTVEINDKGDFVYSPEVQEFVAIKKVSIP